jgi:RHH-type transcriptional regulator, proline utilization regulon repressor / proline dehydrogenase / delta 1-pyrroline-5-carboxylate dehydrogenase
MNYVTPAAVRSLEWVSALVPKLPHLYLTSSRDETVDKALRLFRWHRERAGVAIGFEGGYLGHTTAAARSLSDPAVHRQGPPHFSWPRVPHPAAAGEEASLRAIRAAVAAAGGPEQVLALFYEPCQERTGQTFPATFWPRLAELAGELDLPLCAVETATGCYRSGLGALASVGIPIAPDALLWWGGGQTGYLHVGTRWRVPDPMVLVSTWDGDELSLVREHHQLRAARRLDLGPALAAMDAAAAAADARGLPLRGLGLYRVLHAGDRAEPIVAELARHGLAARAYPGGRIAIAPGLDQAEEAGNRLARALSGA